MIYSVDVFFPQISTFFLCKQKKILANDADLIDIHRRTRNIIYKMMVEILICLEKCVIHTFIL